MPKVTVAHLTQNPASTALSSSGQITLLRDSAVVIAASALMAICAHVSLPLVFSPVPLTLQTFGVLLIGFALGRKRAFAALALYLGEGAAGLPVFSPAGPGGIAQIVGATGGFLMAYPLVAYIAGWLFEQKKLRRMLEGTFGAAVCAAVIAEIFLFASGMVWLKLLSGATFAKVATMALVPFIPGEVLKIAAVAAIASRFSRVTAPSQEILQQP